MSTSASLPVTQLPRHTTQLSDGRAEILRPWLGLDWAFHLGDRLCLPAPRIKPLPL